jgi:Domain of unknown function (DUF1833)
MYSSSWKKKTNKVAGDENPLILLEINHPLLAEPVRVVNDKQDVVSNGHNYIRCAFDCTLPSDPESGSPRARIAVDNVGRELMQWVEASDGAPGATGTIRQIMRSEPDLIEFEATLNMTNISATTMKVSADLTYEDTLNLPANPFQYRPETAPGLF